jgi:hypothetical protein
MLDHRLFLIRRRATRVGYAARTPRSALRGTAAEVRRMALKRTAVGVSSEPKGASNDVADDAGGAGWAGVVTAEMRLQILMSEHASLTASRSLAWNESFSRGGMFLSSLSGVIVGLALIAQGSGFGDAFVIFAMVLLPIALFIGVTSYVRMGAANYTDAVCVVGMNRIRAGYLEIAPDLERFLVMSPFDDADGIDQTMTSPPGGSRMLQLIAGSPTLVGVLDAVIAGALASLVGLRLGLSTPSIGLMGVVAFIVTIAAHAQYAAQNIRRSVASFLPAFPRPAPRDAAPAEDAPAPR